MYITETNTAEALAKPDGSNHFEEISSLAYDAVKGRLVADISLTRTWGFGTAACLGSTEFLRFFRQVGSEWQDCGLVACHVVDEKLREGAGSQRVHLPIELRSDESVLNLRAILSWQMIPPSRNAEWHPVWGEVKEFQVAVPACAAR